MKQKQIELHRREQLMEFHFLERIRKLEQEKRNALAAITSQESVIEALNANLRANVIVIETSNNLNDSKDAAISALKRDVDDLLKTHQIELEAKIDYEARLSEKSTALNQALGDILELNQRLEDIQIRLVTWHASVYWSLPDVHKLNN